MSIQAVGWVLDNSQTRGFDRLVMIALANRVNGQRDDGEVWPSMRTIAHDAGMSAATVAAAVRRIAVKYPGELEVTAPGGPRMSARYLLPFAVAQRSGAEHNSYPQRSGAERSARARGERSARPWGEQNRKEPEVNRKEQTLALESVETLDRTDDRTVGFAEFWEVYPRRNGKLVGKQKALARWQAIRHIEDRRACFRAAKHYRAAVDEGLTIAKDPERFLAAGWWRDWLEPATPDRRGKAAAADTSAASLAAVLAAPRELPA